VLFFELLVTDTSGPRLQPGFFPCKVYFYLDRVVNSCYTQGMAMRLYTTREVAKRAGISRQTLQSWIAEEKVKAPAVLRAAGVRLWTESDLVRVLKLKPRKYPRGATAKEQI
jgi:transposase